MTESWFEPWLKRWALVPDGEPIITPAIDLLPVRPCSLFEVIRVVGRVGIANVLHAKVTMSSITDWIRSVISPHQLKHRKRFRIMDDRPLARIRSRQGVGNGLGKNPLRRVFFRPLKSCQFPCGRETGLPAMYSRAARSSRQHALSLTSMAGKPVSRPHRSQAIRCRMVNRLHQSAGMSSVYASPRRLFWIHQLSSRMHSGSRMIDHRPGWPQTGCRYGLEKPASAGFFVGAGKSSVHQLAQFRRQP
ncbi:hypothetical protein J2W17_000564 [Pseudomonas lini]|nr:hypothetical protein [Pseudomonas lini]